MTDDDMTDVDSSLFSHIGHDGKNLHIKFHSGTTYKYQDCPEYHIDKLINAESPGAYFHEKINGKYKHST